MNIYKLRSASHSGSSFHLIRAMDAFSAYAIAEELIKAREDLEGHLISDIDFLEKIEVTE